MWIKALLLLIFPSESCVHIAHVQQNRKSSYKAESPQNNESHDRAKCGGFDGENCFAFIITRILEILRRNFLHESLETPSNDASRRSAPPCHSENFSHSNTRSISWKCVKYFVSSQTRFYPSHDSCSYGERIYRVESLKAFKSLIEV